MERVKKGERYWYIVVDYANVYVEETVDNGLFSDKCLHTLGNYFHTKEEAEAMAEKIRKVLKGAIVIDKFPSEEEVREKVYTEWMKNPNSGSRPFDTVMSTTYVIIKSQLTKEE